MEGMILNSRMEKVFLVDRFISFIWTDRYQEAGEFELVIPMDSLEVMNYVRPDGYITIDQSDHVMLFEAFVVTTDVESGNQIKLTGGSLEGILKRRIIWDNTVLTGNLQDGVHKLLNDAIISPSNSDRKIDNFVFKASTDKRITDLTVDTKYESHENLYDAISSLCTEKEIGFKIVLTEDHKFEFSLYKGQDRSYRQNANPYVVFSPSFENLKDTSYLENKDEYKNVCLVSGEDTDTNTTSGVHPTITKVVTRTNEDSSAWKGLSRREAFVDAGSIASDNDMLLLTDAEKQNILEQKGQEQLAENVFTKSLEGDVDPNVMWKYGKDFSMGDIVQIENEYGIKGYSTVSEYVITQDGNGETSYPTFTEFKQEET